MLRTSLSGFFIPVMGSPQDRFRSPPESVTEVATDLVFVVVLQAARRTWPRSLDRLPSRSLVLHAIKAVPLGADVAFQVTKRAI
jgi:hypothetical protein